MDLRAKKTERALREAFLALRAEKPLERISVRELCERAEVGKGTFYLHYHSVYDLSEQLQRTVVEDILAALEDPQLILTDTEQFTREFTLALLAQHEVINALFSGGQEGVLPLAIEAGIREHLFELRPSLRDDVRLNVLLTYQIQGSFHAYHSHATGGMDENVFDVVVQASGLLSTIW
ncbi:MAG: TetR/AcrR family transcriptional regulator [Coriobacteriales bacterium]|nr:TetR/AcrR family transcriptional regulator [Coriobacteriales bacterium]